ncbi:MAG: hypothetical protein HY582_05315 [Candidatus Omnitrophica bacterium]|nr:hypothetical protein [Candidatus Omnitrophota bacterium]
MLLSKSIFWLIFFGLVLFGNAKLLIAQEDEKVYLAVSEWVNQMASKLIEGEAPDKLFSIYFQDIPVNEARSLFLDPHQWIQGVDEKEIGRYIGSLAFARIKAPFFRVANAVIAYEAEAKFIPGIVSSKVVERKRESSESEFVLIEREREIPVALKALIAQDGRYQIENRIQKKEGEWLLVHLRLSDSDRVSGKCLMKVIEGFEYVKNLGAGEALYLSGGFALPNTGFLKVGKKNGDEKKRNGFGGIALGVLDKVAQKLDVGSHVYRITTQAVLEGAYQDAAAVIQ